MPVYNGDQTVDRAVTSLQRQTFTDWELLAVDDGSTDASYERLRGWSEHDPRIRVLRTAANRGPSAARNEAIRHATAEMIAYLDCDDEFYPDYLEQVARLCDRADVLIFGYDYVIDGEDLSQARTWDPTPRRQIFFEKNLSTPLGVAHRRGLWGRVGGFDESAWIQEDWDFWKRLARTGAEFLFVPLRSGLYRFREGSLSHSPWIAPDRRAAFEANWADGGTLYRSPDLSMRRHAVRKILFASPYSYFDPRDPVAARGMLELLARSGFTCQAFCGVEPVGDEEGGAERTLREESLPHEARDALCGPYAAQLIFTRKGDIPVTLVQPRSIGPGNPWVEAAISSLAFFEKFLDTYQPDVLLTHCSNPSLDPITLLAKQRDIPIVVPLLDAPCHDPMAFYAVDYCVVTSENSRRRYWEDLGLSCILLPPLSDAARAGPAYAEFFRNVHPQPGPPFIPV
jgi:glycosyltransferase involved in cell wall biosynthesis